MQSESFPSFVSRCLPALVVVTLALVSPCVVLSSDSEHQVAWSTVSTPPYPPGFASPTLAMSCGWGNILFSYGGLSLSGSNFVNQFRVLTLDSANSGSWKNVAISNDSGAALGAGSAVCVESDVYGGSMYLFFGQSSLSEPPQSNAQVIRISNLNSAMTGAQPATWTVVSQAPSTVEARVYFQAFLYNNYVYVFGGSLSTSVTSPTNHMATFSLASYTWTDIAQGNPPPSWTGYTVTTDVTDGNFLLFGGSGVPKGSLYRFSTASNQWSSVAQCGDLPNLMLPVGARYDNFVYAFGGQQTGLSPSSVIYVINLNVLKCWSSFSISSSPSGRYAASSLVAFDNFYVVGGRTATSITTDIIPFFSLSQASNNLNIGLIVGLAIGGFVLLVIISCIARCLCFSGGDHSCHRCDDALKCFCMAQLCGCCGNDRAADVLCCAGLMCACCQLGESCGRCCHDCFCCRCWSGGSSSRSSGSKMVSGSSSETYDPKNRQSGFLSSTSGEYDRLYNSETATSAPAYGLYSSDPTSVNPSFSNAYPSGGLPNSQPYSNLVYNSSPLPPSAPYPSTQDHAPLYGGPAPSGVALPSSDAPRSQVPWTQPDVSPAYYAQPVYTSGPYMMQHTLPYPGSAPYDPRIGGANTFRPS